MKLTWTIAHDKKLVVVHIKSQLDPEEVRSLYAAIAAEGALPYRKLVDASFAPLTINVAAIGTISQLARAVEPDVRRGPVAFVANSEIAQEMIQIFDHKMSIDRPLRIFRDTKSAMRWLDEIAPLGSP
jgi:hypothetical protein